MTVKPTGRTMSSGAIPIAKSEERPRAQRGSAAGSPPVRRDTQDFPAVQTLQRGSKGPLVEKLKTLLSRQGFDPGPKGADFGSRTRVAVLQFQKARGLEPSGVVDAKTWAKLEEPPVAAGRGARAPLTAQTPEQQAAAQVEQAYQEGGAEAGAAKLEELTAGQPPEVAAQINAAARSTVDKILADLRSRSHDADGGQGEGSEEQRAFDQTLADLSAALGRGASTPQGKAELEHASQAITTAIREDGIGRFDEALGNTALGGPYYAEAFDEGFLTSPAGMANADTSLALAVVEDLNAAGSTGQADDVLQNLDASLAAIEGVAGELADKVASYNQDLAQLVHDWSGVMTEEALQEAIAAFKAEHPEYAALEQLSGGAIRVADQLAGVPDRFPDLGHADDIGGRVDRATDWVPELAGLTDAGAAELARLLESSEGSDEPQGIFGRIAELVEQGQKGPDYLEKVGTLLLGSAVSSALAALQSGDLSAATAAIESLQRQAGVFGLDPDRMAGITESLDDLLHAGTDDAREAALDRLSRSLDGVEGEGAFAASSNLGKVFRGLGVVLGVAIAAGSIEDAIRDRDFESIVGALSSAVDAGEAGVTFAKGFFQTAGRLGAAGTALEVASTVCSVLTTGISVYQAASALEDGDAAKAGLYAAQAAGGILILAGSTGIGAVVVAGAALGLAQLERVRASNHFESDATRAFLEAAGVSPEAANQLCNCDSEGRMVGPQIVVLAEQLGVDPRELFLAIGQLPPDEIKTIVETMHGVDPDENGEFPMTDPSDSKVGQTVGAGHGASVVRPKSIQGIIQWLDHVGIDLAELVS